MKKKNIAISLIVTMIIGICFFAGSILASGNPKLSITPSADKAEVGSTVNYDVVVKECDSFGGIQFEVVLPAGLKATAADIVAGKEDLGDNLMSKASILTSGNVKVVIGLADGRAVESLKIATFSCEVIGSGKQTLDVTALKMSDGSNEPLDPEFDKEASAIEVEEPVVPCEHLNTEIVNAKEANCEEDGYTGDTYCLDCEQIIEEGEVIPALGHDFDEGVVTTEPGCETEGVLTRTCGRCGATEEEIIEALGHDYDEGVVTTEPGCETEGVLTRTCQRCGATVEESIEALGHDYDEGVVTTEPGCEVGGIMTLTCQRCGATKEVTIEALGHIDENGDKLCDRCGVKLSEEPEKPVNPKEDKPVTPATGISNVTSYIGVLALMVTALFIAGAFILKRKYTK